jgi:hypothetical protein
MKKRFVGHAVVACVMCGMFLGCGPETAAIVAVGAQCATAAGTIAGTAWLLKNIENVSLDTEKKKLEVRAIQDGTREVHRVDLSDSEFLQIRRTGKVRFGDQEYRVQ